MRPTWAKSYAPGPTPTVRIPSARLPCLDASPSCRPQRWSATHSSLETRHVLRHWVMSAVVRAIPRRASCPSVNAPALSVALETTRCVTLRRAS